MKRKKDRQKGQALLLILVFAAAFVTTLVFGFQIVVIVSKQITRQSFAALNTYALTEAGIEDAAMMLRRDPSIGQSTLETFYLYTGDSENIATITIEPTSQINARRIISVGTRGDLERSIQVILQVSVSQQTPFHSAVHVGNNGITMNSNSRIHGNAYSNGFINAASNTLIEGDAYAHLGFGSAVEPTVTGTRYEGEDAPIEDLPYVDTDYWKEQANINNDPYVGDLTLTGTPSIGPKKIEGNLTIDGNVTITGPVHVTGDFIMNSNTSITLDEGFGSIGTIVIADGLIEVNSNTQINPTLADPKGYIMLLTTNTAISSPSAMTVYSNTANGLLYAYNGGVEFKSNSHVASVSGQQLILASNAELTYDTGLANAKFDTGPGGYWNIVSWEEIE